MKNTSQITDPKVLDIVLDIYNDTENFPESDRHGILVLISEIKGDYEQIGVDSMRAGSVAAQEMSIFSVFNDNAPIKERIMAGILLYLRHADFDDDLWVAINEIKKTKLK